MKYQLDKYCNYLKKGVIKGIILCSNSIADLGIEAVDYTCNWIAKVGDEVI